MALYKGTTQIAGNGSGNEEKLNGIPSDIISLSSNSMQRFEWVESNLDEIKNTINNQGNANCLDYGATLHYEIPNNKILSSDGMPYDCQMMLPTSYAPYYAKYISVDYKSLDNMLTESTSSMYYCNIARGQNLNFRWNIGGSALKVDIVPYRYGNKNSGVDIIQKDLRSLSSYSVFPITRCLYAGPDSNGKLSSFTQLTDLDDTEIYRRNDMTLEYNLVIELSASEYSIGTFSELFTPYVMTTQNGVNKNPHSILKDYSVRNNILPGSTTFSSVAYTPIPSTTIVVPNGQFLYLKYSMIYNRHTSDSWTKYPSFIDLLNGNVSIGTPNIYII